MILPESKMSEAAREWQISDVNVINKLSLDTYGGPPGAPNE